MLRIKKLGTEFPVEQTNINLQGFFTLYNTTSLQTLRRVQISDSDDFADLRDNGELVFTLGAGNVFKELDLTTESCQDAIELYEPTGLSLNIVLLITCRDRRVLCVKYSNGEYSIDSIFVSEYTSSTPVIVTNNGISTAIYTVVAEGISALAIRSLEPNGYEQFMYEDTFEDTFGSCMETLSYNETHVRLSCSNKLDFYLVDGRGETDGRKIYPQGMGDLVNIYNEDIVLVVSSSSVTINTKESTNFCTLDLPTPVTRVDYARINGKLLLLFFSSQDIYQYDTSTSCVNENLVILVNEPLLGLNGRYQNYLIFGDLLVYTVMNNELYSSRGIDLSTSQNIGVLANHQNHPLLYGITYENRVINTTSTIGLSLLINSGSTLPITVNSTAIMMRGSFTSSVNIVEASPVAKTHVNELPIQLIITVPVVVVVLFTFIFVLLVAGFGYIFYCRKETTDDISIGLTDLPHSPSIHNSNNKYLVTQHFADKSAVVLPTDDKITDSPPSYETVQNGNMLN